MAARIEIKFGESRHATHPRTKQVFAAAQEQLKELLSRAYPDTQETLTFAVAPTEKVTMKGDQTFRLSSSSDRQVWVNVKPGDNDTAWRYGIVPPPSERASDLHQRLFKVLPKGNAHPENGEPQAAHQEQETQMAAATAPQPVKSQSVEPATKQGQAAIRQMEALWELADRYNAARAKVEGVQAERTKVEAELKALQARQEQLVAEELALLEVTEGDTKAKDAAAVVAAIGGFMSRKGPGAAK